MLERGGGSIVNTASAAAFYGSTSLAAYGTSKAGLVALTRYVATAYGERGIRCNAVAPGVVVDRATRRTRSAARWATGCGATRTSHLVGRLGYPEEIAARGRVSSRPTTRAFVTGEIAARRRRLHRPHPDVRDRPPPQGLSGLRTVRLRE